MLGFGKRNDAGKLADEIAQKFYSTVTLDMEENLGEEKQ